MRVAELVLEALYQHGVRQVFGIPGDAINDFTYALHNRSDMDFVLVRHEEAGAFAASAQAKLTGELSCCMGTAGGGSIHLLNGLYDAKMDKAPVIAITGQVATDFIGTGYHQEVDTERLFSDVAVYSKTVMDPGQLPGILLEAIKAALSERGPAHISVPTNIAGRKVPFIPGNLQLAKAQSQITPADTALRQAADMINGSSKPVILAGIGGAEAKDDILELAAKLKAPIVRTLRAKDWIDERHVDCVGGLGLLGGRAGSKAMDGCDCLIMLGTDYPYVDFYPKSAKTIQVDRDIRQLGKRTTIDVPLHGDVGSTLKALVPLITDKSSEGFRQSIREIHEKERKSWVKEETSSDTPLKPQTVLATVGDLAPENAVFLCDTGTVTAWSARHLQVHDGQRFVLSACLGTMAFAMSGALGAQLKFPDRPVVALAGDGGFAMLMADFVTAVRYELPITVVILENKKLGFIALEQEGKGLPEHSIDLVNPDFVAFAKACGGVGLRADSYDSLQSALKEAFSNNLPTVINAVVDPEALIVPPEINMSQAYHFGLAKTRESFETIENAFRGRHGKKDADD
ncbi:thiamine pyrophosphate-dependent enzyme [Labrenzia sp. OB1]|uniref:thiamine pyrophosphate-dependent enzyme n=1 Tax=Labrenzia sp. OB1 TaxID=1561204 RepID=UPI000838757D|nr:thiamine pyrophosphate-dependent enzyme [Labrenzia sp. OB1]